MLPGPWVGNDFRIVGAEPVVFQSNRVARNGCPTADVSV